MSVIDNRRAAAAAAGETVTREAVIRSAVPKRHYWKVVRLIVLSDIATVVLATVVASVAADPSKPLPPLGWVLVTVPLTVMLFSVQRLYERDRSQISISTVTASPRRARSSSPGVRPLASREGTPSRASSSAVSTRWRMPPVTSVPAGAPMAESRGRRSRR